MPALSLVAARGVTRAFRAWARPLAGLGILAFLLWRLGAGPFLDGLRLIDGRAVAAALGIGALTTVCCAWRWSLVAGGLGLRLPLRTAVADCYRSVFLNATLPGGVLGDVHRAVRHGRDVGDVGRGVRAVVWERTAGQLVQLAVALVVLSAFPSPVRGYMPAVTVAAVACVLGAALLSRVLPRSGLSRWHRALRTARSDIRHGLLARRTWLPIAARLRRGRGRPPGDVPDRRPHGGLRGAAVPAGAADAAGAAGDGAAGEHRRVRAAGGRGRVGVRRRRADRRPRDSPPRWCTGRWCSSLAFPAPPYWSSGGSAYPPPPRREVPSLVELPVATVRTQVTVPLRFPDGYATTARVFSFDGLVDGREHVALGLGDWAGSLDRHAAGGPAPLVRPHSECLTGDVFGSQRCDCGPQLREAVERIAAAGGLLLYLRQEGRGIGLYTKLEAYALQDAGLDTYEANVALGRREDERDYTAAAQMLGALGVERVALLSNNPDKAEQLDRLGVAVVERVPTGLYLAAANAAYLAAKARRAARPPGLPFVS